MIKFRHVTIEDLDLLKYWDTKQHVIDCDPDEDWDWDEELSYDPDWRELYIAELNNKPIGAVQIIDPHLEETHYWGINVGQNKRAIDIWIGEEYNLNKGYGTIMMHIAIKKCFENEKVKTILIDPLKSNTKAQRFYRRFGFEFIEDRFVEGILCSIYELKREKYFTKFLNLTI